MMKNKNRKAFSLIEMLVVMGIISILLGGISLLRMQGSSQLAGSAQQVLISAFSEAKNLASSKHSRTRVLIYKGSDEVRMLRQIAIVYEQTDEDGNSEGWITSNEIILPKGAFFIPPASAFNSYCVLSGKNNSSVEIIKSTFANSSGVSSVVGMSKLSVQAQSMSEGSGDWYSYEFAPEGFSENAGAVVAVAAGKLDGRGKMRIEKPEDQLGFVVRKYGACIGFSNYFEMKESLR